MKRFLLWSFERGSVQYDVICVIILSFIFLAPRSAFKDRPKAFPDDQQIRVASDDDGHAVYTVGENTEEAAVSRLKGLLGKEVTISRTKPIYDGTGALVAYSIWVER